MREPRSTGSARRRKADLKKAFDLYSQAAEGGNLKAKRNLAYMYYLGAGVRRDYKKAAAMFKETS